jgi:hypothetical protein
LGVETFVLAIAVIVSVDVALKIKQLGSGKVFERTRATVACDTAFNAVLVLWAVYLLGNK